MKERFIIISATSGEAFLSIYESDTEEIEDLFFSVSNESETPSEELSLDDLIKALQHSTLKDTPSVVYDSAHPTDLFFPLNKAWRHEKFPFEITFNEKADLSKLEAAINKIGCGELVGEEMLY